MARRVLPGAADGAAGAEEVGDGEADSDAVSAAEADSAAVGLGEVPGTEEEADGCEAGCTGAGAESWVIMTSGVGEIAAITPMVTAHEVMTARPTRADWRQLG